MLIVRLYQMQLSLGGDKIHYYDNINVLDPKLVQKLQHILEDVCKNHLLI